LHVQYLFGEKHIQAFFTQIEVAKGAKVQPKQVLVVLESMKMEMKVC
jgi:biotin carboxyl carrier protein